MTVDRFPRSAAEVTGEWVNNVLRDAGVLLDHAVAGVDLRSTAEGLGFVGSCARVELRYRQRLSGVPRSLFLKFSSANPDVRASLHESRLYEREVRFYREAAPKISLRIPRCYLAEIHAESGHSILVLEDLRQAREVDLLDGCSGADAEAAITALAGFHAKWWRSPVLDGWTWLSAYTGDSGPVVERSHRTWKSFRHKLDALIPARLVTLAEPVLAHIAEIRRELASRPATLVHGDFKAGNLLFDLPDAPLAVLDWQLAMRAPAVRDVSVFLAWSMGVESRREQGGRLLQAYHDALVEAGVRDYPFDAFVLDFRFALMSSLLMLIAAGGMLDLSGERATRVAAALIERNLAILEDYQILELL
jgi:hypothetical protein